VVGPAQLAVLLLELGQPLRVAGRDARPHTAVDLGLADPVPQSLGMHPQLLRHPADRTAPLVSGSRRNSTAIRVARSRNSSLNFFGADMTLILHELKASIRPGAIQTARPVRGEWQFDTPKTERSVRSVPLPSWLAELVREYMDDHPHGDTPDHPLWPGRRRGGYTHGKRGSKVKDSNLQGSMDWSSRWEPESFCRNVFKAAVDSTPGVGHVRFHDLRHTFASICDDRGVPVARVSAWMGHSTTTITMDTYQHLFRGDEDTVAIELLEAPPAAVATNVVRLGRSVS
jgi:hypothetical protein